MDYVHYQWVRDHVQHYVKDIREEMREFAEELGKITGTAEKERREQAALLLKLEALTASQAKQIEAQGRTIKALESKLAAKKKDPELAASYRPTMNGSPGRRLS